MQKSQRLGAFTLVEILVVLGIIAILVALLFPVIAYVRASGYQTQCVSNLKQIGLAWQMYADDSDGRVMPSGITTGTKLQTWAGEMDMAAGWVTPQTGLLFPWTKTDEILSCPSSELSSADSGVSGYGYNDSSFTVYRNGTRQNMVQLSAIEKPAELVLFADAAMLLSAQTEMPVLVPSLSIVPPSSRRPTFHARHRGMGNVLWADGHVKAHKPMFIESDRGGTVQLQSSLGVGFIDKDGNLNTNEFFDLK